MPFFKKTMRFCSYFRKKERSAVDKKSCPILFKNKNSMGVLKRGGM